MNVEEWKKGVTAWENIKRQAEIDIEQADLFLTAIKEKIKTEEMKENGE